jgi:hypothetical protein
VKTGSFATTGSNTFIGTENITGNLTVTGSVIVSSGSAVYNSSLNLTDTSSLTLNSGSNLYVYDTGIISGTFKGSVTGSLGINGNVSITGSIVASGTSLVSGSSQIDITSTTNYTTFSSSVSSSIGNLSSSVATNTSGLAGRITTIEGRGATTGSNTFVGSQVITGSLYITNDMIVQGCSCLQNITASAVSIGTNVVMLNTATPAVRFAGISVQDSGSNAGVTGSIFWDGLCNKWIYSNPSNVGYSGGMLISGPRNTGTIGNETPLTCNVIAKSGGGDHIYDSCIIDDGTTVCINANLKGSGISCFAGTICSPTFAGTVGCFSTSVCSTYGFFPGISIGGNPVSAGTGATAIRFTNSGGDLYIGQEGSTASNYYPGSKAYDNVVYTTCSFNFIFGGGSKFYLTPSGVGCFASTICTPISIVSGCLGVGTVTPRTKAEFSSGLPTSIPTYTNKTNGIVVSDGGDIYGRIGVSDFSAGGSGYPTYIQAGDYSGVLYYNLLLNPLGGCIGIGTTAPATNLHISNNSNAGLRIQATASNGSSEIDLLSHGTQNAFIDFGPNQLRFRSTNCDMTTINDSIILTLNNNGCVGVNTCSPRSTLHIQQASNDGVPTAGCARDGLIISSNNGNYGLNIGVDPTGPSWIQSMRFDSAIVYNLLLQPSGGCSVLIGTGTALSGCRQQLIIGGNSYGSTIAMGNNGDANKFVIESDTGENVLINNKSNTPMIFYTNNCRRMDILGNGCVGIGCTSPGAQLVVGGACNGDTTLHLQSGTVSGKLSFSNNTANTIYGGGWWGYMGYSSATYHLFGQCVSITGGLSVTSGDVCFAGQICSTGTQTITGPGLFINRPASSSGEPYIFFNKDGVNRGSIYGGDGTAGLRFFSSVSTFSGNIVPDANGTRDLGSSSLRWCTVYTSDLSLNNGIGNYTIVEGESDLFLYNNNSCKVFKFLLQEVCKECAPAKMST